MAGISGGYRLQRPVAAIGAVPGGCDGVSWPGCGQGPYGGGMVTHRGAVESSGTGPLVLPSALDKSVALRKSGLVFARIIPFRTWECVGQQLFAVADSSTWWIADWLAYGESTFQSRYYEASQKTSLKYQTLRNYAWVARRFELSRRRDNLSFGHHAEVSALDRPEQDYWLRKAEELGWSRNQLRAQVRTSLR